MLVHLEKMATGLSNKLVGQTAEYLDKWETIKKNLR